MFVCETEKQIHKHKNNIADVGTKTFLTCLVKICSTPQISNFILCVCLLDNTECLLHSNLHIYPS